LSWAILFTAIAVGICLIMTVCVGAGILKHVNLFLFFSFALLYSLTFFGWAFLIVAFLPTSRTSGIAATLWHIVSYYLSYILRDASTPAAP
jgi:hypothetical protein